MFRSIKFAIKTIRNTIKGVATLPCEIATSDRLKQMLSLTRNHTVKYCYAFELSDVC